MDPVTVFLNEKGFKFPGREFAALFNKAVRLQRKVEGRCIVQ